MKKSLFIIGITLFIASCANYQPEKVLNAEELESFTTNMLPYIFKRPDHVDYTDRENPKHAQHYREMHAANPGGFTHLFKSGDTILFNFTYKDYSSLYEHYRAFGGKVILNKELKPDYLHMLYHTPRIEPAQKVSLPEELFKYMVKNRNVEKYIGNRDYIKTPSEDFYYDIEGKHWEMTPNSSWRFLEDMKQEAEQAMTPDTTVTH